MSDDEETAIAKLEGIHANEFVLFSREEAETLKKVAKTYRQFEGAVAIGGALGSFLKWFVILGAGFAAIRAGLLDWLIPPGGNNP